MCSKLTVELEPQRRTGLFVRDLSSYNKYAIHTIWWSNNNAVYGNIRYAKWSTMFPKNFTEGMVAAILTKAVGGRSEVDLSELGIPGGTIKIEKAGNTMYPHKGSVPATSDKTITIKGDIYAVDNHA